MGADDSASDAGSKIGRLDWAGWSLVAAAVGIAIDCDNQSSASSLGRFEQVHVAQMQYVETAVDEDDPMVLLMPEPRQLDRFLGCEDVRHGQAPC